MAILNIISEKNLLKQLLKPCLLCILYRFGILFLLQVQTTIWLQSLEVSTKLMLLPFAKLGCKLEGWISHRPWWKKWPDAPANDNFILLQDCKGHFKGHLCYTIALDHSPRWQVPVWVAWLLWTQTWPPREACVQHDYYGGAKAVAVGGRIGIPPLPLSLPIACTPPAKVLFDIRNVSYMLRLCFDKNMI